MGIGLGVGINRSNYAQGIFNAYSARVVADGGVVEGGTCVDAVSGILLNASLLLIPSGYKSGKAYAEIPTNGNGDLTWTRGSDAFRTNASGLIQRVPWNLLQYSEAFDNASWVKNNATITSNSTTSPNGTLTADTISSTTVGGEPRVRQTVIQRASVTVTLSCYAKKGSVNWVFLRNLAVNSTAGRAWFNINTGTIGTVNSGLTASIENVGDGWYRCSITGVSTGLGDLIDIAPALSDNTINSASVGESVYIWGAQLVEGTTAQTYLPTTDRLNFPRLSYMYGSCPSALLEPQRTNLALYSDDFSNAYWLKSNTNATANTTTSPDGSTNADTFAANGTTSSHALYKEILATSGVAYTATIYAKANTGRYLMVRIMTSSTVIRYGITVDLQNGSITQTSTTATAPTGTSSSVTSVGNGWYRISLTMNTTNTTIGLLIESSNTGTPTLDAFLDYSYLGSESYYIYGAQLEQGAYPTTYIPTTTATATRVADSFSRSNIYTNGLISASGGTWFVELRNNIAYTRDAISTSLGIYDVAGTNGFTIKTYGGSAQRVSLVKVIGSETSLYATTTDTVKIVFKWNGSTADVFVNGTKQVSATAFTATQLQTLQTAVNTPMFIQAMALYPTPLSDTDCQTLTTL